jgi:hypothetical protein
MVNLEQVTTQAMTVRVAEAQANAEAQPAACLDETR